jgi:MFS superfamily sulfate permease-like transporter
MSPSLEAWMPKSVILLRDYTFGKFTADLIAGVTVRLVALPLAMAFAIASRPFRSTPLCTVSMDPSCLA